MKILSAQQIREVDAKTIASENIPSLQLMKRAANAFYDWFIGKFHDKTTPTLIVCGTGNNGGDGLVIARLLAKSGYSVKVWMVESGASYSEDCAHNVRRAKVENISVKVIVSENDMAPISGFGIVIDALFGTGLNREVTGVAREVIRQINNSGKPIVSVDVPSGLFLDKKTFFAVQATETVTFQIPKLALFLPDNYAFTGNISIVNIGLNEKALLEALANEYFTQKESIKKIVKPLPKFAHKGTQGHALIVGGSLGKMGSVCLAAKAALRAGCGLITAYVPSCGTTALQCCFPEAMVLQDKQAEYISDILFEQAFDAIGVGVGMGQYEETQDAFHRFLTENKQPLVVDADGLNILSQHPDWLSLLPPKTVLTPHPKELSRLIGAWDDDFDKIKRTTAFAEKFDVIVVLKGAYTMIFDAETLYVNSSGTPALATAGSGDVLTGIITGFIAQGYAPIDAARIGVFLHGLTADVSKKEVHPRSFTASDILHYIGKAYFDIEN